MKRSYYLGIYLPILSIFFTFYAMVLIVIFLKRKDHILGSIFFSISFFLGIIELTVVSTSDATKLVISKSKFRSSNFAKSKFNSKSEIVKSKFEIEIYFVFF